MGWCYATGWWHASLTVPCVNQNANSSLSRRSVLAGAGSALLIRTGRASAAELEFTVTELPIDLDGHSGTFGRGINRKATVVGIATGEKGPVAVRSRGKKAWSLPSTDLPSIANAVNDAGIIAGALDNRAALWEDDEPRLLAEFGDDLTTAYGINRDGLVVGSADKGANRGVAVRWSGDRVIELPSLGGPSTRALAVNADGVIAGFSTSAMGNGTSLNCAFCWKGCFHETVSLRTLSSVINSLPSGSAQSF